MSEAMQALPLNKHAHDYMLHEVSKMSRGIDTLREAVFI
jgi:hypothetical protein